MPTPNAKVSTSKKTSTASKAKNTSKKKSITSNRKINKTNPTSKGNSPKKNTSKTQKTYSKILVTIVVGLLMGLSIWSVYEYFILTKLAIEQNASILPDATLPIATVSTILGTILSYMLYNGYLKGSLNKHGLIEDKTTGLIKSIFNENTQELINEVIDLDSSSSDESSLNGSEDDI